MRSMHAVFQFYSQVEKGNDNLGFYTKYKLYSSAKFNMLIMAVLIVFVVVVTAIIQFSTPNPVPFVDNCVIKVYGFITAQLVLVIIFSLFMIWQIWKVNKKRKKKNQKTKTRTSTTTNNQISTHPLA